MLKTFENFTISFRNLNLQQFYPVLVTESFLHLLSMTKTTLFSAVFCTCSLLLLTTETTLDTVYILPYFIKGAGGTMYPSRIAAYGGNSIRTLGSENGQQVLDIAQKYGLTVLMGLDVARERHGFNYDDTGAVKKQLEKLRSEVLKYRNHPALLAWGIGNEFNLQYKNPQVWDAVNVISKMIHGLDPNHPTCTVLAGVNKDLVEYIKQRCPDIDFLSINTYGGWRHFLRVLMKQDGKVPTW